MPAGYGTRVAAPGAHGAYATVPQVPSLIDIYGEAPAIGARVTAANQEELNRNLESTLPGWGASNAQAMATNLQEQKGIIPNDVVNFLKQQAQEGGVATGLGGPNINAALMRALGTNSLALQNNAEAQLSSLVHRTPQAPPFNIPAFSSDLYDQRLLKAIYDSAADPRKAAQQLISDQIAGYNRGRGNVPPEYSGGMPTPNAPYSPIVRSDITNPTARIGPYVDSTITPSPARAGIPTGNLQAGGGNVAGLEWDPEMGAYWNKFTNQYVPAGPNDEVTDPFWTAFMAYNPDANAPTAPTAGGGGEDWLSNLANSGLDIGAGVGAAP